MMRTLISRRCLLNASAAGLAAMAWPAAAQAPFATGPSAKPADGFAAGSPVSIEVKVRPIPCFDTRDHARTQFGALEFRSGLVLTSADKGFGGLSGLRLDPHGERFIAISDHGSWFTGRIRYHGIDMIGLEDVEAAPLLGPDGRPITARGWFDSESIALDGSSVYIGLERVNLVLRFDFAQGMTRARGELVAMPPAVRRLPDNKGLEALVFVGNGLPLAGTLIAISERGLDTAGNLIAFLVGGPTPGVFSIVRSDNFDISDATALPSGELLLLERKFSLFDGAGIRIRRLALGALKPGAVVDGPVIFEAGLSEEIDNMEGIDGHVTPEGDTVLTMVSDDNFSLLQRTLLLQFKLVA